MIYLLPLFVLTFVTGVYILAGNPPTTQRVVGYVFVAPLCVIALYGAAYGVYYLTLVLPFLL